MPILRHRNRIPPPTCKTIDLPEIFENPHANGGDTTKLKHVTTVHDMWGRTEVFTDPSNNVYVSINHSDYILIGRIARKLDKNTLKIGRIYVDVRSTNGFPKYVIKRGEENGSKTVV